MTESIREYAFERLSGDPGFCAEAQPAHNSFFAEFVLQQSCFRAFYTGKVSGGNPLKSTFYSDPSRLETRLEVLRKAGLK